MCFRPDDTSKTFSLEVGVECIRLQASGEISVRFSILIRRINKCFVESSYLSSVVNVKLPTLML